MSIERAQKIRLCLYLPNSKYANEFDIDETNANIVVQAVLNKETFSIDNYHFSAGAVLWCYTRELSDE